MFEDKTFDVILQEMLDDVDEKFDKREGSIIYDALAAAAAEFAIGYIQMDTVLREVFADTASREYLILRANERGLKPYEAEYAIVKAVVDPVTVELIEGQRFNLGEYNYSVYEPLGGGEYLLICETSGAEPNSNLGFATPIEYIDGLSTIEITEIYKAGADEEETEDFRKRYFESLRNLAFGGNVADYKEKTMAIDGVGGVKVVTATDLSDGGKVVLYIIDNEYGVPESDDLKNSVQTAIDPIQNHGLGLGIAPIGHTVTVDYAAKNVIDIGTTIEFSQGWSYETAYENIRKTIDEYFTSLNKEWDSSDSIIVRVSQIESRLLELEAVADIYNTTLNLSENNLRLLFNEIAVRGTISVRSVNS